MVKLTKIYTKTGDEGETGLGGGERVSKVNARVEAYGTVDEANCFIGVAAEACGASDADVSSMLRRIQNDLFDVGADLCTPRKPGEHVGDALRVTGAQTAWLEEQDRRDQRGAEQSHELCAPGRDGARGASACCESRGAASRAQGGTPSRSRSDRARLPNPCGISTGSRTCSLYWPVIRRRRTAVRVTCCGSREEIVHLSGDSE